LLPTSRFSQPRAEPAQWNGRFSELELQVSALLTFWEMGVDGGIPRHHWVLANSNWMLHQAGVFLLF